MMDFEAQPEKSMNSHQGQESLGRHQEDMEKSTTTNVHVSGTAEPESEIKYPKGIKLAVIIASLAASVFLCALVRKKNAALIVVAVHSVVLSFL
jgi:hypothetical protein